MRKENEMNREILFRGKRVDNGEWVYGQYAYLLNARTEDGEPIKHMIVDGTPFGQTVDPSTVGQYTGLTDKNSKKVFEGDILKWDSDEYGSEYNEICSWDYELLDMRKNDWKEWCEVIDNIHDNPDLMEGE